MDLRSLSLAITLLFVACTDAYGGDGARWNKYKSVFLTGDGRVVDYFQDKVSHSEGQGYGMWLSVVNDDRAAFELIWQWTKSNLQIRSDSLFAWQWGKRPNNEWKVIDYNNATDGDVLIAYALLLARDKWQATGYRDEAIKIIKDLRNRVSIVWQGRTFLLPGYSGFTRDDGLLLNPSYLIVPAFRAFSQIDQRDFWEKIIRDGEFLIDHSLRGIWLLPADWVLAARDSFTPYHGKDPYFGYNAVRLLLYLNDDKAIQYPKGVTRLLEQYQRTGLLPLWVDLEKDSLSLRSAPAGYYALYALAAKRLGNVPLHDRLMLEANRKVDEEQNAYYSYTLFLLSIAAGERVP